MLTRRDLLGIVATSVLPPSPVRAETAPVPTLRLSATALPITTSATACLSLRSPGDGIFTTLPRRQQTNLKFENAAIETVAFIWQGLRGSGQIGSAPAPLKPGASASFPVSPLDSGTALVRAAPSDTHAAERGARAVILVPDSASQAVDQDVVVMLEDWLLAADGTLRFGSAPASDVVSSLVTVNGRPGAHELAVAPGSRLRLRFVNASVQRVVVITCSGGTPFICAIDGQPSALFAPARNTIPVGPGARYDLMLDGPEKPGAVIRFALKPTLRASGQIEPERDFLVLRGEGDTLLSRPPIAALPPNDDLPSFIPLEKARRVELTIVGGAGHIAGTSPTLTFNGKSARETAKPILLTRQGNPVVLGFTNASSILVPLRVGGHAVRILHDRDDGWHPYWRDTLLLPPGSRTHVAFMAEFAGLWPIDSGYDDLTRAGLRCVFEVTPR